MEFETWDRTTLVKEIKNALQEIKIQSFEDFIKLKSLSIEELNEQTDHELKRIYVEIKMSDQEFNKQYKENIEKKRFFNKQYCDADFSYWAKQAYWKIDEAITLILGKDPRKVTWEKVKQYLPESPFANKFNEIRELARRYINYNQLYDSVYPGIFLAWAQRMQISIPNELQKAVNDIGIQVADWKSYYDKSIENYNRLNKLHNDSLEILNEQEKKIEILNNEISSLKEKAPVDDELKETERQSLYKIISAMAFDGYKYNASLKKTLYTQRYQMLQLNI